MIARVILLTRAKSKEELFHLQLHKAVSLLRELVSRQGRVTKRSALWDTGVVKAWSGGPEVFAQAWGVLAKNPRFRVVGHTSKGTEVWGLEPNVGDEGVAVIDKGDEGVVARFLQFNPLMVDVIGVGPTEVYSFDPN